MQTIIGPIYKITLTALYTNNDVFQMDWPSSLSEIP